jgi:hypothetical protein
MTDPKAIATTAGWNIPDWCTSTSISRASFYLLVERPKTVKLGRRRVVVESPRDYLARIASLQKEAAQ